MKKSYVIEETDSLEEIKNIAENDKEFELFISEKSVFYSVLKSMSEQNELNKYKSGAETFGINEIYGKVVFLI